MNVTIYNKNLTMRYCKIIKKNKLKVELTESLRAVFMYKFTAFVIYFIEHLSLVLYFT